MTALHRLARSQLYILFIVALVRTHIARPISQERRSLAETVQGGSGKLHGERLSPSSRMCPGSMRKEIEHCILVSHVLSRT